MAARFRFWHGDRSLPDVGATRIHVRFKGGKTETLTTNDPKSAAQQVKTNPEVIEIVDALLDTHIYPEIAAILNDRGVRPGGSARRGQADAQFTALRVAYLAHEYKLRPRYDRLRAQGMLSRPEAALRLGISEAALVRWAEHGLVRKHAYNAHYSLYELPEENVPVKHSSRWDRLADRAAALAQAPNQDGLVRRTRSARFAAVFGCSARPSVAAAAERSAITSAMAAVGSSSLAGSMRSTLSRVILADLSRRIGRDTTRKYKGNPPPRPMNWPILWPMFWPIFARCIDPIERARKAKNRTAQKAINSARRSTVMEEPGTG